MKQQNPYPTLDQFERARRELKRPMEIVEGEKREISPEPAYAMA